MKLLPQHSQTTITNIACAVVNIVIIVDLIQKVIENLNEMKKCGNINELLWRGKIHEYYYFEISNTIKDIKL